ncbi:STAS-like domain-containing protein [Alicyclobacillus fastidiosus]|uniref:STAS-like domain-containing protein n=1 Tax=Alicyclobacillus fastidiosus TaxID=392011 RepID=A0ABY6ZNR8_9BACL|nr:STAS-like domain-containing protein [Alicyclobacillus fastidiosus]WAH43580.1 STAS-like domain-containing protein [Alicyclobacillus fastidiosus]GMA59761.1 hypothetical protein GCM10025859_02010 [Alicyclobacillus fastidiosus]GMA65538.1 hypothetical protein GCM10025859_59780 [Alicyclobacillus fastidiosus]
MLKIREFIGENCITREDGDRVYNMVFEQLKSGSAVDLDFSGVNVFASPFFNAAIGKLRKEFSKHDIENRVHVHNLSAVGRDIFALVLENSDKYYSDQTFRRTLDDILSEEGDSQ